MSGGSQVCRVLPAQFGLHPLDYRGQLDDTLAQDGGLRFDLVRVLLARSFAIGFGREGTGKRAGAATRDGKMRARRALRRRPRSRARSRGTCFGARVLVLRCSVRRANAARVTVRVRGCADGFAARLAPVAAGSGGRLPSTSRDDGAAATTGASIAGGSMNSVYSRRTEVSHPAWSVSRTTGS